MDCLNHPGAAAAAYCQNCGKPMCSACVRQENGQVLCEPCATAWRTARPPFAAPGPVPVPGSGEPNPSAAAVLGIIPGVGAMYNGQFVKGFIHVAIFAVLVTITSAVHSNLDIFFGLLIPAWILYQAFEAYHTARARLEGEPLPDPLGLNELAGWFHAGVQTEFRRMRNAPPPSAGTPPPGAWTAPNAPPGVAQAQQSSAAGYAAPYAAPHSNPYQSGYQPPPFTGAPPAAGFTAGFPPQPPAAGFGPAPGYGPYGPPPGYGAGYAPIPPVPPPPPYQQPYQPPYQWRRRPEPIAAIVLIALGVLFLAGQVGWLAGRMFEFSWPVVLIALGAWLLFRRMYYDVPIAPPRAAAPPGAPRVTPPPEAPQEPASKSGDEPREGSL